MGKSVTECRILNKSKDVDVRRAAGMAAPPPGPNGRQRWRMAEVRAPQKTLAFFEGARIWLSLHGRARASGPAALFALRAVFEAAALIYGDVYDALKPFAQKARGSRGRNPRSRRGAAVTSVHSLVICRRAPGKAPAEILIHRKRMVGMRSNLIVLWCSIFLARSRPEPRMAKGERVVIWM